MHSITFIYHSHKISDQQAFTAIQSLNEFAIHYIDLAKEPVSYSLLTELTRKLNHWQLNLADVQYMDHSIKNPEDAFLNLSDASKIKFLQNNVWSIGTPIVIDKYEAFRFVNPEQLHNWVKLKNESVLQEEFSN